MKRILAAIAFVSIAAATTASAGEIGWRQAEQQRRIAHAAAYGALSPRQVASLERQEARLRREITYDRARQCGRLTPWEVRKISFEQSRIAREIRRDEWRHRW